MTAFHHIVLAAALVCAAGSPIPLPAQAVRSGTGPADAPAASIHPALPFDAATHALLRRQLDARLQSLAVRDRIHASLLTLSNRIVHDAALFLYATLPLGDLLHPGFPVIDAARQAVDTRDRVPWGRLVPDTLFLHFVLPPRVNNEELDEFRAVAGPVILDRIRGLTMREAALEINRWCHEHVTYRPTDARTASPLAVMQAGFGRCGEESTLLTAALRAAGIPARQCYVPRWAHQDDNHAWVEAWVDGRWYFMGACEPEPDLDMGWFAGPATRAMLIATTVVGPYSGSEPVLAATPWSTRIGVLANYAPVRALTVRVRDERGAPVPGALADLRVFNYGEFHPLYAQRCDGTGHATFITGVGDALVWVRHGERFGVARAGSRTDTIDIVPADSFRAGAAPFPPLAVDLTPPMELPPAAATTDRSAHDNRMRHGDSLRAAYAATFIDSASCAALALRLHLDPDSVRGVLTRAAGNWREIEEVLVLDARGDARAWTLRLLASLVDKDLRDAPASVLRAHLRDFLAHGGADAAPDDADGERTLRAILAPRIGYEGLTAWRAPLRVHLAHVLTGAGAETRSGTAAAPAARIDAIAAWVRDSIRLVADEQHWARTPIPPLASFNGRAADRHGRDLLFVAACRAVGIPARLDAATRAPEAWDGAAWRRPYSRGGAERPAGTLTVMPSGHRTAVTPRYGLHYSIARIDDGRPVTLDFDDDPRLDSLPSRPLQLDTGRYLLVTGIRRGDGGVRARLRWFRVEAGDSVLLPLELREEGRTVALGRLDPDGYRVRRVDGTSVPLRGELGGGGAVLLWARPAHEPSRHVLGDLASIRTQLAAADVRVLVCAATEAERTARVTALLPQLPRGASVLLVDRTLRDAVVRLAGGSADPVFVFLRSDGTVSAATAGYRIGTAELLMRILTEEQ